MHLALVRYALLIDAFVQNVAPQEASTPSYHYATMPVPIYFGTPSQDYGRMGNFIVDLEMSTIYVKGK